MNGSVRLRVGVIVGSPVPAWVAQSIAEIEAMSRASVAAVFTLHAGLVVAAARESLWVRLIGAIDRQLFPPRPDPLASRSLDDIAPGAERVKWPVGGLEGDALLRRLALDAVVDYVGVPTSDERGRLPPLGIWTFRHDGTSAPDAAVWAVLRGVPWVRSELCTRGASPVVLIESVSRTDHVSATRALANILSKSVGLPARTLSRMERRGAEAYLHARAVAASPRPARPSWPLPFHGLRHAARYLRHRLDHQLRPRRWILLKGHGDALSRVDALERLLPPDGRFWADPFVVAHEGRHYVFFEEFVDERRRGHISVAELDSAGRLVDPRPVLERPYHLSYPFLFEHEGAWFMLPETSANATIELYRCQRFPDRWSHELNLMQSVRAVDTTLLHRNGRWWLFTNLAQYEGASNYDDLFLFDAPGPLTTEWRPHPMNPIVSDVRRARPAGPFIERDGRLYRPSQDCAAEYGRAVVLNEVLVLSEDAYEERPVGVLEPDWDPQIPAVHTLAQLGSLVLLDGKLKHSARSGSAPSPRAVRLSPP
jgi:hypothetical protein